MTQEMLTRIHRTLDELEEMNIFAGKTVVIFGSNEPAERMIEYLADKHISVSFLIDNNEKKKGTTVKGIPVYLPKDAMVPKKENIIILIASRFYSEMVGQLSTMGYEENVEIWNAFNKDASGEVSLTEKQFEAAVEGVRKGQTICDTLRKKYDNPERFFLCMVPALGDIYLAYAFIKKYVERNNINRYLILVPKGPFVKLAQLFGLEDCVITLESDEIWSILHYATFSDMEDGQIVIVNHKFVHTRGIGELGNYQSIRFTDMFRYGIFGLEQGTKPERPIHLSDATEYVNTFFAENGLERGKTVILMPYAKTSAELDVTFWEELTGKLTEKGYIVCTNSGGEAEPVVKNTKGIFFDIRYAIDIVEAAGFVIGLRSGLCDVIATADAKKIILYPDRVYGVGSFYDYYNLSNMELCGDTIELIWKDDDMVEKVLREVEG